MASSLIVTAKLALSWVFEKDSALQSPKDQTSLPRTNSFDAGSGSGQLNQMWADQRVVAVGANDDLDLTGVLKNIFGDNADFSAIKMLTVINLGHDNGDDTFTETAGDKLKVGGAGSGAHAWGAPFDGNQDVKLPVDAGSILHLTSTKSGMSVAAGASDILRIQNAGTVDLTYQIILAGVS